MEQVVTQLQQELLTLRAQVASQVQMAEAVRAVNNLATAQVQKDSPGLIDVNGLGGLKEFSGKEEDFQQWSKNTEAFFAGVIEESEMMLEWSAEKTTEIATELINREFLPTATNQERGVQNLEIVLQQMHTALTALASFEANDIVANRHGGGCRNDMTPPPEEGRETFFARSFLQDVTLFWNSKQELNAGSPVCRATRRS